jgi:hypothetical protein
MAAAAMGAIIGSIGVEQGTRMGGGVLASSKAAGMHELAEMAANDGDLAMLLKSDLQGYGLGLVVQDQPPRGAHELGDEGGEMGDDIGDGAAEAHIDGDEYGDAYDHV